MTDEQASDVVAVTRQDLFSLLGALGAVLTLGTATMYYFGWRRSDTQAQAMEMDVSLFGFSTQDYVLRGLSSLYAPALVLAALTLAWLGAHRMLVRFLASSRPRPHARARLARWLRGVTIAAALVATACIVYTWEGATSSPRWPVVPIGRALADWRWTIPGLLVLSTLTAIYARWMAQLVTGRPSRPMTWSTVVTGAVTMSIVALGLFWVLEDYAATIGRRNASLIVQQVPNLPRASVISPTPLHIDSPNVVETPLQGGDFKTTGLRLLARSGGRVILLHDGWAPESGTVIVIADSDEFVWQYQR